MTPTSFPSFSQRFTRAMRRKCPRCGVGAFDSYFKMKDHCAGCGLRFEREPGYWVGATTINTAVIFATFLIAFAAGILTTWPDVPWAWFLIGLAAVNIVVPILFYPISKTLWSALELGWNRMDDAEIAAAADRVNADLP